MDSTQRCDFSLLKIRLKLLSQHSNGSTRFSLLIDPFVEISSGGGQRGYRLAVSSCFWNSLKPFGRKNDGFTVPFFLNGFQIVFTRYDSRSQVVTKLQIKATKIIHTTSKP